MSKKKVCFIIPDLEGGGAERVLLTLLKHIDKNQFEVELLTFKDRGVYLNQLPSDVKYESLHLKRVRFFLVDLIRYLSNCLPKTLIIFNVNNINLITLVAKIFFPGKFKVIVREPTILSLFLKRYNLLLRSILFHLHKLSFKLSNKIIALSKDMADDLNCNFNVPKRKVVIIPNPVGLESVKLQNDKSKSSKKSVVFIGRILKKKGIHKIIEAFNLMKTDNVNLFILGDSDDEEYKEELKKLVADSSKNDHIIFTGFVTNPDEYLSKGDVLAMASEFEGFPNAAVEANSFGIPIVAFESIGGLNDIIIQGVNGWKIPKGDTAKFAEYLDKAINGALNSDDISNLARRFDTKIIVSKYEQEFKTT